MRSGLAHFWVDSDHAGARAVEVRLTRTRDVAGAAQLRSVLKQDGRDLMAEFRALVPHRRPVAIQHWSLRRIALSLLVLAVAVAAVLVVVRGWTVVA